MRIDIDAKLSYIELKFGRVYIGQPGTRQWCQRCNISSDVTSFNIHIFDDVILNLLA